MRGLSVGDHPGHKCSDAVQNAEQVDAEGPFENVLIVVGLGEQRTATRHARVVEKELEAYGHGLVERPRILVINKQELIQEEDLEGIVSALTDASGRTPLLISAAMSRGLTQMLDRVWSELGI